MQSKSTVTHESIVKPLPSRNYQALKMFVSPPRFIQDLFYLLLFLAAQSLAGCSLKLFYEIFRMQKQSKEKI